VATGAYDPKFVPEWNAPQAPRKRMASNRSRASSAARWQGRPTDQVYADYRWGPVAARAPTFTIESLTAGVRAAHASGTPVAAHATSVEGMRNRDHGRVDTIEPWRRRHAQDFQIDG